MALGWKPCRQTSRTISRLSVEGRTLAGSLGGPPFPGHPIPDFIPTLPPFPSGNPNPSGTIPTVAPNPQILVGGQRGTVPFPFPGHNTITTQPTVGTQLPGGTIPTVGGCNKQHTLVNKI
jgi:hypothetical protein